VYFGARAALAPKARREVVLPNVLTVVATVKEQHRNVLDYLTETSDAANWGEQAPSLLPAML